MLRLRLRNWILRFLGLEDYPYLLPSMQNMPALLKGNARDNETIARYAATIDRRLTWHESHVPSLTRSKRAFDVHQQRLQDAVSAAAAAAMSAGHEERRLALVQDDASAIDPTEHVAEVASGE